MEEAWTLFRMIRWPKSEGAPVCPHCGCPTCWACPRPNGAPRFRCSACRRDFSPTSGTLFAFHKLEIRDYLAAVVIFCDEVKGKAALALSRDLDVQYKTAFVLAHKIREAIASEVKDLRLGGAGRHVEIDGCYVGGHVRPANRKADRTDRRLAENRSGRRQVVVVIRERALPAWAAPCPPCFPARMLPPA
jgi:transposase-like protein